jgi:hypothetical protein
MTHLPLKQSLLALALLLIASEAMSQLSLASALDRLEKQQLITAWEKSQVLRSNAEFEKRSGKGSAENPVPDFSRRDEMLSLLAQAKKFSTSGTSHALSFVPAPAGSRSLPVSAIRAELDSFIHAVDRAGLLSAYTKEELLQKNRGDAFGWKIQVAEFAYGAANEEYYLRPEKLKRYADQLLSENVISTVSYQLLLQKSAHGDLHRYSELSPYLNFCITISPKEMPSDSIGFLRALYAATSKVLPGLEYDTISFRVIKNEGESEPDFQLYNLVTTVGMKGKSFSYAGFYHAVYKGEKSVDSRIPGNYYSLFNKVLADLTSPYRLHIFPSGNRTFGVIALTEKQFNRLNWTYDGAISPYLQLSYEQYARRLTQSAIAFAIKDYDSLGLFSHLSKIEKDSCMEEVNTREILYYSDILKCFKNLVLDIDAKYGIDSGQYAYITRQAALFSRGQFRQEKILEGYTYEHPQFTYGFAIQSKSYSASLHQKGKYLDPEFWALIEKAVKENDRQGQFHHIYPSDGYTEIYLTNAQFAFLQLHQLLEFTDPDERFRATD